jgi:arylsulfatase A-like enzyme
MKLNRLLPLLAIWVSGLVTAHADLASLFTNANHHAAGAMPRRTSIIVIQCHDLALGDLSCYGQTNYETPNLDRLARNGIRFTQYTGAAESAWTTAALLHGKTAAAPPGEANLAQLLRLAGYHTGLIGEWSQPGQPWKLGFDEFVGFLEDAEGRNYYADYLWRYAPHSIFKQQGEMPTAFEGKEMIYANTGGQKGKYLPDLFFSAAGNFVRNNEPDFFNHYRPFFLLLNLPAPRPARTGADEFPVPSDAPFSSEPWPQAAKNRAALISRLDTDLGRLLEQIDKLKLTNNLAVFFTSSSAPAKFADPKLNFLLPPQDFRSTNQLATPPLPMIAWWPGKIAPGQVSDKAWSAVDFAPTAVEIGLVNDAPPFAGHSILPVLSERRNEKAKGKTP